MSGSVTAELRRRVEARDEEAEIESAFSDIDAKLQSLVELIDTAHESRVAELEQETAGGAAQPLRSVR